MMNTSFCYVSGSELNQIPLMSHLVAPQLNKIQKTMKQVRMKEGENLFVQGQPAERFYLVRSGQIKLYRVSLEGSERVIDIKQPGQVFAESIVMLDKCVYPVSADAMTNTELLAFEFSTFRDVLEESRETCFQFMADMSRGLQQYLDQIDYLTFQNASFRLVNYLLQQVPPAHAQEKSCEIKLAATKSIIASWLAIQPETFSRILRNLKSRNLIKVNGNVITLLDVGRLREFTV